MKWRSLAFFRIEREVAKGTFHSISLPGFEIVATSRLSTVLSPTSKFVKTDMNKLRQTKAAARVTSNDMLMEGFLEAHLRRPPVETKVNI